MSGFSLKAALAPLWTALRPARRRPITLAEALPWIVPKVRTRFEHEALSLGAGKPGPEFRPLAGVFAVSLVLDLPDQDLDLSAAQMSAWNTDFDRLMQKARSNLLVRGAEEGFRKVGSGCYRSVWRDGLDGSRVLLPGVLRGLQLRGDPVVALPNRDTLLVAGAEDPDALRWLMEETLESMDQDVLALNGCLLRLRHYQWETCRAAPGHPAGPLLAQIEVRRLKDEYALQKLLLDQRHWAMGQAITLAPFLLQRTPGGQICSFTTWSEAMGEAWLPRADQVRLAWERGGEPGRAWVSWEKVQARLSHLLEPVGLYPERYRFRQLPEPDLLERLLG